MRRANLAAATLCLVACGIGPGATQARKPEHAQASKEQADTKRDELPEGLIRIAEDMLRDLRITTAGVEQRIGGEGTAVLGEVRVNEERYAEVSSPMAAQAVRLIAAPGDRVREGQPLVELASLELGKARGEYGEAEARLQLATQALSRKRGLAVERIVPQREVQEAEAEVRTAEAALRAARASLESMGVRVGEEGGRFVLKTPVAGTVLTRSVVRGQVVDAGRPLFKVADLGRLWVTAHASERDALRVRPGGMARVALPALPGRTFDARVELVGKEVDAASRTIPVRLELANADGTLRPGMSATVWLPVGEGTPILSVPAAALQRLHDAWCVFVPKSDGVFELRPVGRGRDLGGEVEILSGLTAGETVIVEGAFLLKAEAEKAESAGGHHDH